MSLLYYNYVITRLAINKKRSEIMKTLSKRTIEMCQSIKRDVANATEIVIESRCLADWDPENHNIPLPLLQSLLIANGMTIIAEPIEPKEVKKETRTHAESINYMDYHNEGCSIWLYFHDVVFSQFKKSSVGSSKMSWNPIRECMRRWSTSNKEAVEIVCGTMNLRSVLWALDKLNMTIKIKKVESK